MSEHSEYYHDEDRNKPLPGATVSSKEEVLQTLLDAARGEITALTEANKLLAAQVAACEPISDLLKTWPDEIWLQGDEEVLGEFPGESESVTWCSGQQYGSDVHYIRADLAGKVSARAADAPSEPSFVWIAASTTFSQVFGNEEAARSFVSQFPPSVGGGICITKAVVIGKSRAADALDSQPTVPDAVDAQRYRYLRDHGDTEGQPCIWLGAHWYGGSNGVGFSLDDAIDARISSSQPTDGEVRNG